MRTQFSEQPAPILIRRRDNVNAWCRLRRDIKQETFDDGDGGTYSMWTADEVEIVLPLKLGNEHFINANFDAVFDSGDPIGVGRTNEDIDITAETLAICMEDIELIAETVAGILEGGE